MKPTTISAGNGCGFHVLPPPLFSFFLFLSPRLCAPPFLSQGSLAGSPFLGYINPGGRLLRSFLGRRERGRVSLLAIAAPWDSRPRRETGRWRGATRSSSSSSWRAKGTKARPSSSEGRAEALPVKGRDPRDSLSAYKNGLLR